MNNLSISSGNVVGRKIAKNQPTHRPWGLDVEFSCLTPHCTSRPWDLTWYDSRNKEQKRQHCSGCKTDSPYLAFSDIEGRYSNKLFRGTLPDVYWTPWPLPSETAGLFYLKFSQKPDGKGKRKGGGSPKGKEVAKKSRVD